MISYVQLKLSQNNTFLKLINHLEMNFNMNIPPHHYFSNNLNLLIVVIFTSGFLFFYFPSFRKALHICCARPWVAKDKHSIMSRHFHFWGWICYDIWQWRCVFKRWAVHCQRKKPQLDHQIWIENMILLFIKYFRHFNLNQSIVFSKI